MMPGKDDDAASIREDSFLAELIPQVAEHLAGQHAKDSDTSDGRERFLTWLDGKTEGPVAGRIVIVMPTYNERQNLESITGRVRAALPVADLLVVDDNSPDGTGDLADKLAEADPHMQVMHRTEKAGLGKAYIAGFGWALECGYDVIIEMDADGSHQPEHLPSLVAALDHADLSIGSRWVPGGKVVNWPKSREVLSRGANIYTRIMLGLSVRDATAGFRAYRAATLQKISLSQVASTGYSFQIDLTLRVAEAGLRIVEVPITFVERDSDTSKISSSIILEAFWQVTQRGAARRIGQLAHGPWR